MKRLLERLAFDPAGRVLAVLGIVGLVLCQQLMTIGGDDPVSRGWNDALHIPLFATLALLFMRALGFPRWPVLALVCVALAVVTETMQLFTGRDASIRDVGRDLLGAIPMVAVIEATQRLDAVERRRLLLTLWMGTLLLLGTLTVAGPVHALLGGKKVTSHRHFAVEAPWRR